MSLAERTNGREAQRDADSAGSAGAVAREVREDGEGLHEHVHEDVAEDDAHLEKIHIRLIPEQDEQVTVLGPAGAET